MKFSRILLLSGLALSCAASALAINNTLQRANSLFAQGEYKKALNQYKMATKDPGYTSIDSKAITNGINKCNKMLKKDTPKPVGKDPGKPRPEVRTYQATVNGSTTPSITLAPEGGSKIITVANATEWLDLSGTPDWLAADVISEDQIELNWESNTTRKNRSNNFRIFTGSNNINVNVSQAPYRSPNLMITGISYQNVLHGQDLSKGRPLYSDEMRMLSPTLHYEGGRSDVTKTVQTKIFEPNGNLRRSRTSPEGYSTAKEIEFYERTDDEEQHAFLPALGRTDVSTFPAGEYTIEVYIDDDLLLIDKLYINNAAGGETSYLNVNGETYQQEAFFDSDGETLTFNVRTDGDWSMADVPSWCRAYMKDNELVVTAKPNEEPYSKYDTMYVISGNYKVPIRLQQAGN